MSMRYMVRKLRIMKPAPARSTRVSTTSATISAAVQRRARRPPVPLRPPPSFTTSLTSVFDTCSAGARPKTNAVAMHTPARKTMTIGSMVKVIQYRLPLVGQHRIEDPDPAQRQQQPEDAADHRQQNAFDQQLTDDPPAAGAERDADGNLARAPRRPREQQVGDVGAGNQQHEADRAHQRPEDQRNLRAGDAVVEEHEIGLDVPVGVGEIVGQPLFDALQLRAGLRQRHSGASAGPSPGTGGRRASSCSTPAAAPTSGSRDRC